MDKVALCVTMAAILASPMKRCLFLVCGDITCDVAASLIPNVDIPPEQCVAAQAAAFVICGCPTAPPPDVNLPCAFCQDGSLPANPGETIDPTVPISQTGGEIGTCAGLVALASTLSDSVEDTATCALIQTYSTVCGCSAVEQPATTDVPEEATTVVDEETTGATVDVLPTSTVPVEEETTAAVTDTPRRPRSHCLSCSFDGSGCGYEHAHF